MNQAPVKLDYAHSRSPQRSRVGWHLLVEACCFAASWLAWLLIGCETHDPFDDELSSWLAFMVAIPGTMCGVILSIAAIVFMPQRAPTRPLNVGPLSRPRPADPLFGRVIGDVGAKE